jgi:phage portal protein, HK97 family
MYVLIIVCLSSAVNIHFEKRRKNMGIFKNIFKPRDKPTGYYTGSDFTYLFGPTTSGKSVNEFTAMQTTAVYSCVRILSETVASLPLHIYRYKANGKERVYDHPLYHILHDEPNSEMTSFVFRETLMSHLLIWGNAFAQVIRDGAGRVVALYPLLPNKMDVGRDKNGEIYYTYTRTTDENPNFKDYGTVVLRKQDVLHIPGLGFDGLVGYSPIAMARNAVGMTIACEEYGASFFANGANPGGVLEHPGVLKDPKKVRDSWNEVYRGTNNAHKVAVLEEGMKYQQIGIPPEEAQFLETRKFQINEIARLYRIPPHMVGDLEKSSFSNIEQQSLEFVKYTLDPWVIRWEQAMQRSLLLPREKNEYFIKLNVDGLLRGDYQSRMNGYSVGRQNGWLSANDIREMEDMNQISNEEGGNLYLINGNMTKLKDAGVFANKGQSASDGAKNTGRK